MSIGRRLAVAAGKPVRAVTSSVVGLISWGQSGEPFDDSPDEFYLGGLHFVRGPDGRLYALQPDPLKKPKK